jgi:hypothetical protein
MHPEAKDISAASERIDGVGEIARQLKVSSRCKAAEAAALASCSQITHFF